MKSPTRPFTPTEVEIRQYVLNRSLLQFPECVRTAFAFLKEYGLVEQSSGSTNVRYSSGSLYVDVYHTEQHFELGVRMGLVGSTEQEYGLGEMIQLTDPVEAGRFVDPIALTPAHTRDWTLRLADQVKRYCQPVLRRDSAMFVALARQREESITAFAEDARAIKVRARADEAFRLHEYAEAARLYESIQPNLTPAEAKKLALAKKKAGL